MIISNPIIRQASVFDMEDTYPLVESFFQESAGLVGFKFHEGDTKRLMLEVAKYHVAFVAETSSGIVGVISGIISESPFSQNQKVFKELFWYVLPDYRGDIGKDLFNKCMDYLKLLGIDLAIFASHKGKNDSGLDNFYFYQDFSPLETLWIKKI